jgi:hypothetical protein
LILRLGPSLSFVVDQLPGTHPTLRARSNAALVSTTVAFRPGEVTTVMSATKAALRSLGRRHHELDDEIKALDADLARLAALRDGTWGVIGP